MRLYFGVVLLVVMGVVGAFGSVLSTLHAKELPKFFTYLRAVDDTILQDMRYYGAHNFLGRRVKGYEAAECILTKRAALALSKVQKRLLQRGLSLKVYDCYRPQRAVNDFIAWSKNKDKKTKAEFYPTLPKSRLFGLGYIARRSGHSRGSTVDLTIVPLPPEQEPAFNFEAQQACFDDLENRYQDNSLDFGTGYDCFHALSHTKNPQIEDVARRNRALLLSEMARAGFENYSKEWWHFTLKDEPFKKRYFDFPIRPKQTLKQTNQIVPSGEESDIKLKARHGKINQGVGESLRVVCVADDDVLNVRETPDAKAKIVAVLPPNAVELKTVFCNGDLSLTAWHQASAHERRRVGMPWCEIESYRVPGLDDGPDAGPKGAGAAILVKGWVSGAFVVPYDAKSRSCLGQRR